MQALTIKNKVHGCLEGVFALGQVYVLISRVTDPDHLELVGIPPADMLDEVAQKWQEANLDVNTCFEAAAQVTGEWTYTPADHDEDACRNVLTRFEPLKNIERRVPLRLKPLSTALDPQPTTAAVLKEVLQWIGRCDQASQDGQPRPPSERANGDNLFPEGEWWLTELELRKPQQNDPLDEVLYGPEDVTANAADAWWHGTSSEGSAGSESADNSDASLPAGPPLKRVCVPKSSPTRHASMIASQARSSASRTSAIDTTVRRRRLRGKQSLTKPTPVVQPNNASDMPDDTLEATLRDGSKPPLNETLVISANAVRDAPGLLRKMAKDGKAMVVDDADETNAPKNQEEKIADILKWFLAPRDS